MIPIKTYYKTYNQEFLAISDAFENWYYLRLGVTIWKVANIKSLFLFTIIIFVNL